MKHVFYFEIKRQHDLMGYLIGKKDIKFNSDIWSQISGLNDLFVIVT